MSYPNYPENRLIVGGVDLSVRYQLILLDGYMLSPPEPKTYTVDVPGGDGVIDLTQALTGDVAYSNRNQEFTFLVVDTDNFEKVKTEVSNFLHGKAFDYNMTMDPEYTYHGRFTVTDYNHRATMNHGIVGAFKVKISADPYKTKAHKVYALNATGGAMFRLPSGRKPVHPVIEASQPCRIRFGNVISEIPAGTYRLNDVLFKEGYNDIYINSHRLYTTTWHDMKTVRYVPIDAVDNSDVNLIRNGSFETGDFSDWIVDSHWAYATVDNVAPNSGKYKATLNTPINSSSGATLKSSTFTMLAGHTYKVKCSIKADKGCTLKLGIYGGRLLDLPPYTDDPKTWKEVGYYTWNDLSSKPWYEIAYTDQSSYKPDVYITKSIDIVGDNETWNQVYVNVVSDESRIDSRFSIGFQTKVPNDNVIYIDDCSVTDVTDISKIGITWNDARAYRWDDLQRISNNVYNIPRRWSDLANKRWIDLKEKRWGDIDYRVEEISYTDTPKKWTELRSYKWSDLSSTPWSDIAYTKQRKYDSTVYIKYDWKDL